MMELVELGKFVGGVACAGVIIMFVCASLNIR